MNCVKVKALDRFYDRSLFPHHTSNSCGISIGLREGEMVSFGVKIAMKLDEWMIFHIESSNHGSQRYR